MTFCTYDMRYKNWQTLIIPCHIPLATDRDTRQRICLGIFNENRETHGARGGEFGDNGVGSREFGEMTSQSDVGSGERFEEGGGRVGQDAMV